LGESKEARAARYAAYERVRMNKLPPSIKVLPDKEDETRLNAVRARRGVKKGPWVAALLKQALIIEELGGDAIRVLELAGDDHRRAAAELAGSRDCP
jgi:hypothetical protein